MLTSACFVSEPAKQSSSSSCGWSCRCRVTHCGCSRQQVLEDGCQRGCGWACKQAMLPDNQSVTLLNPAHQFGEQQLIAARIKSCHLACRSQQPWQRGSVLGKPTPTIVLPATCRNCSCDFPSGEATPSFLLSAGDMVVDTSKQAHLLA